MRPALASRWPGGLAAVLLGLVCIAPCEARGDDADDIAGEIVRKSDSRAEAAAKILTTARSMKATPAIQIRLCEIAYEQGMKTPAGYVAAIAALELLETISPTRARSWRDRRLDAYRLLYYRSKGEARVENGRKYLSLLRARARASGKGDNWDAAARFYSQAYQVARSLKMPVKSMLFDRMRQANSFKMLHNRVGVLVKALAANPADVSARRQLVMTYLVDLDRPAEAAKYVNDTIDAELRTNVTMAGKDASVLADADLLALGAWYQSLSGKATMKYAKIQMLLRAHDNLGMYLEVYPKADARRLRTKALLRQVDAELERLGYEPVVAPSLPAGAVVFLTFEDHTLVPTAEGLVYVLDASSHKRCGVAVGGKVAPRGDGKAMVFDGRSYVDLGNPAELQLTGDMTVCMWINPANLSARQNPFNKCYGGEGTWTLEPGGTINMFYGSSGRDTDPYAAYNMSKPLKPGRWSHVAAVRDMKSRTVTWYKDGVAVSSGRAQHTPRASGQKVLIGKGYVRNFQGMLDDVGIFNRALPVADIRGLAGVGEAPAGGK